MTEAHEPHASHQMPRPETASTEARYEVDQAYLDLARRCMQRPLDRVEVMTNILLDTIYGTRDDDPEVRDIYGPKLEALKIAIGEHYGGELIIPTTDEEADAMLADCNSVIEAMNTVRADNQWELAAQGTDLLRFKMAQYIRPNASGAQV